MSWPPKIKGLFTRESIKMDKRRLLTKLFKVQLWLLTAFYNSYKDQIVSWLMVQQMFH
jgi:hypothetical protein